MRAKVSADELLRRFDEAGGQVHHFRGARSCYAATVRTGPFRLHRDHGYLLPAEGLIDNRAETYTKTAHRAANGLLLARARTLPPVTPTLAGLDDHLASIDASTFRSRDEVRRAVNGWCRLVEVCQTSEADQAFGWTQLPSVDASLNRVAAGKPEYA